jgi:hypothetical protein
MKDYRNFEQFVAKYLKESRGMLNEAKDQYFENATVTVEKKILQKAKQDRYKNPSYGKVMFRFTISDLGAFEIVAKGDERATSEIDTRSPKFTPVGVRISVRPRRGGGERLAGGGFEKIATFANQSGKFYLSAKRSRNKQVFFQTRDILFYTDVSDEYYPTVYLHSGDYRQDEFYNFFNL